MLGIGLADVPEFSSLRLRFFIASHAPSLSKGDLCVDYFAIASKHLVREAFFIGNNQTRPPQHECKCT
jgi:hypothetical protein